MLPFQRAVEELDLATVRVRECVFILAAAEALLLILLLQPRRQIHRLRALRLVILNVVTNISRQQRWLRDHLVLQLTLKLLQALYLLVLLKITLVEG